MGDADGVCDRISALRVPIATRSTEREISWSNDGGSST